MRSLKMLQTHETKDIGCFVHAYVALLLMRCVVCGTRFGYRLSAARKTVEMLLSVTVIPNSCLVFMLQRLKAVFGYASLTVRYRQTTLFGVQTILHGLMAVKSRPRKHPIRQQVYPLQSILRAMSNSYWQGITPFLLDRAFVIIRFPAASMQRGCHSEQRPNWNNINMPRWLLVRQRIQTRIFQPLC